MPRGGDRPGQEPVVAHDLRGHHEESATTEPTERSISPAASANVIPTAMTAIGAACRPILSRLEELRKPPSWQDDAKRRQDQSECQIDDVLAESAVIPVAIDPGLDRGGETGRGLLDDRFHRLAQVTCSELAAESVKNLLGRVGSQRHPVCLHDVVGGDFDSRDNHKRRASLPSRP